MEKTKSERSAGLIYIFSSIFLMIIYAFGACLWGKILDETLQNPSTFIIVYAVTIRYLAIIGFVCNTLLFHKKSK